MSSKFKDIFGAATNRASNAREKLKQKAAEGRNQEPEVYDAQRDHECLDKGICDNPNADPVNLQKETIKECAKDFQEGRGSKAVRDIDTSSLTGAALGQTGGNVKVPAAGVEPGVIGAAGGGTGMHDFPEEDRFKVPHPGQSGTAGLP